MNKSIFLDSCGCLLLSSQTYESNNKKESFMFKTIHPHEQTSNQDLIYPFISNLKVSNPSLGKEFSDTSKAIFILPEDNRDHMSGGAVLLQKNQNTLHPQLIKDLNLFIPSDQKVWTGTIKLDLKPEISRKDFERCSEIFYKELAKALVAFSRQKRSEFVCLSLTANEQLATELLEKWPYVWTIRPTPSEDGLFHSILSLTRLKIKSSPAFQEEIKKILLSPKETKELA
jgi:hypothetical protein